MMKDQQAFVHSAHLYLQASQLVMSTLSLQQQIQACNSEIVTLLSSRGDKQQIERIRSLKDEIFGCKIEVQALRLKAHRLNKEARNMRFPKIREGV